MSPSALRSLITSAVASCAAVTLTLLAKVLFSVPTLPELAQDKLVQSLPGPVFAFMLRNLLYLGKPMFFITLLVLEGVVLTAIGLAALRWRVPILAAGAVWLVVGLVFLPLLGRGVFDTSIDVALINFLALAVYAGVLYLSQRPALVEDEAPAAEGAALPRRRLLAGGVRIGKPEPWVS